VTGDLFSLRGLPVVITGAAGLLGRNHALAVAEAGGIPVLLDINSHGLNEISSELSAKGHDFLALHADTTNENVLEKISQSVRNSVGPVHGIVNNVAMNPPMGKASSVPGNLEDLSLERWDLEHTVSLRSAFLMAKYFGAQLVERGRGSIVNVASDLALIAPDQRIYGEGEAESHPRNRKPMTYSSTKSAMLGISRYLATYWSPLPIRSNALIPGSVLSTQSESLQTGLKQRIPLARLARPDEYKGALIFMLSEASAYMTGATVVVDGGRTAW
jgi:NAD(P)-dependent dehydrogenase (short-subunit alcohol dehydrogenase family)